MVKKRAKKRKGRMAIKPAMVVSEEALEFFKSIEDEWDKAESKMLRKALRMDRKRKPFYIA